MEPRRRQDERRDIKVSIHVHPQDGNTPQQANALNISVQGMLMEIDGTPYKQHSEVRVVVDVANSEWDIEAKVIHTNSRCMGIKFLQPQQDLFRYVIANTRNHNTPVAGHLNLT